jgi:uncharacterized protein with HEPN domain
MNKQRNDSYFVDILNTAKKIVSIMGDISKEDFIENEEKFLAISRLFEIMGEAAKNVSSDFKVKHKEIPWRKMAGIRDVIIHDYRNVKQEIVWKTVKEEIPKLILQLEKIVES